MSLSNIDQPKTALVYIVALYETHAFVGRISGLNLTRASATIEHGRPMSDGEPIQGFCHGSREQMAETFDWLTEEIFEHVDRVAPRLQVRVDF